MNLVGQRFGHLVIIEEIPLIRRVNNEKRLECLFECDCGKQIIRVFRYVRDSRSIPSCGCMRTIYFSEKVTQHGRSGKREYKSWQKMKERCNYPTSQYYADYGGRGMIFNWKFAVCMSLYCLLAAIITGSFYLLVFTCLWYYVALNGFDERDEE